VGSPSRIDTTLGKPCPKQHFEAVLMYPDCATLPSLYADLHAIDLDLAARTRELGCPFCGGPLDFSRWTRKPRGRDLPAAVRERHGLCCRREGCRRRVLPPSTLFLGRRVYWAAVVLVVVVVRQRRLAGSSARKLREMFGVTHRTLLRWVSWFERRLSVTDRWRVVRGAVPATVRDGDLPSSLLTVFDARFGAGPNAVQACLRLLAGPPEARFSRGLPAPQKLPDSAL
jgi:hypothetical protein